MQIHKDYRVNMVSNLIIDLKDINYKIRPLEMAEKIVELMDRIYGMEYKNKVEHQIKDYKSFNGTKV
jgi:hypothetical protein